MDKKFNKCFQVGFNKTATTSLHVMFQQAGLRSAHWFGGHLAHTIQSNHKYNLPLLSGITDYDCYTDVDYVFTDTSPIRRYFQELDTQYPGSLFIFNKRNVADWINSRFNQNLHQITQRQYMVSGKEIVAKIWENQFETHASNLRKYFKNNSNFIEFDIDTETDKLYDFLERHGFQNIKLPLVNTTKDKNEKNNNRLRSI